jgi:hypothetical protein
MPAVEAEVPDEPEFGRPIRNLVREEPADPLEEANLFLKQIPTKMRLF